MNKASISEITHLILYNNYTENVGTLSIIFDSEGLANSSSTSSCILFFNIHVFFFHHRKHMQTLILSKNLQEDSHQKWMVVGE